MNRSRYVKAPQPSAEVGPMYRAVVQVLSKQLSVTQAAQALGLSRLRFQTRMHRGLNGLLEALEEQPRGRPETPEVEQSLMREVEQLRQENQRLSRQLQASARMMGLASEWMHKGLRSAGRQRKTSSPATTEAPPTNDSDEEPARRLAEARKLMASGVSAALAATAVGASAPTVRRWSARSARGEPLVKKRGPAPGKGAPPAAAREAALTLLDETQLSLGAATIARATGMSRRAAANVKAELQTQREAERRAEATRVDVVPGVIRGFDPVMLGKLPVFAAADAAVNFRTLLAPACSYDGPEVASAMDEDFEQFGPPYVWRVDRAKAHRAPAVMDVLTAHGVLLLQGPPHCPRYYGQLERQNREHRACLGLRAEGSFGALVGKCARVRHVFNELVPRRKLGWLTPGQAWRASVTPVVDRRELAEEVEERRRKLEEEMLPGNHPGMAERLAIETALINRGLLRFTKGGWC